MGNAKRVDKRHRVTIKGSAVSASNTRRIAQLLQQAIDEGRSFQCVVDHDHMRLEIGPRFPEKVARAMLEREIKRRLSSSPWVRPQPSRAKR